MWGLTVCVAVLYAGIIMLVGNSALLWIRGTKTGWKLAVKI